MAKIYIKFNSAVIKEVELTKDETTFGRKSDNDIHIDHPTVSGHHGKIKKEGDHYVVEDLNSTNGTFINGHRIKTSPLKSRDQIGVASHVFEFVSDNAEPPSAAPNAPAVAAKPASPAAAPAPAQKLPTETPQRPPIPTPGEAAVESSPCGIIRIVAGGVDGQTDIKLKDLNTYIGTADQAAVKIKGFMAPSLAAVISRRAEGYFLKAVKAGYPKVNGNAVSEQIFLENGALIEVGSTNMVFYQNDKKPA